MHASPRALAAHALRQVSQRPSAPPRCVVSPRVARALGSSADGTAAAVAAALAEEGSVEEAEELAAVRSAFPPHTPSLTGAERRAGPAAVCPRGWRRRGHAAHCGPRG